MTRATIQTFFCGGGPLLLLLPVLLAGASENREIGTEFGSSTWYYGIEECQRGFLDVPSQR